MAFARFARRLFGFNQRQRPLVRKRRRIPLWVEELEGRIVPAGPRYLVMGADSTMATVQSVLATTEPLAGAEFETFNTQSSTPTLEYLQQFEGVLNYTNFTPTNPIGLGDVLADYVDAGGRVVLATYSFSSSWAIGGRIVNDAAYSPFSVATPGTGFAGGNTYHSLSSYDSADPMFAGITGTPQYWTNFNYTNPPLATGGLLLASDDLGNRVVAQNQDGSVVGISIYAGYLGSNTTDPGIYRLFANALTVASGPPRVTSTTPALNDGPLTPGLTSLQIHFSRDMVGADVADNYHLQGAGPDGQLGSGDDVNITLGASYSHFIATLTFSPLASDLYRLTVKDSLTDTDGEQLDGDADRTAGGNYVRDFAGNAPVFNYALVLNQVVHGQLYSPFQIDHWTFSTPANQQIQFNLVGVAGAGIQFDLTGPNDVTLFKNLTATSDLITLTAAGEYVVTVHGRQSQGGAYSFSVNQTNQTELVLGTPFQGTLLGSGQVQLFKVEIPDGAPLLVHLDDTTSTDSNELYVRRGAPPTRGVYDYRFSQAGPDQDVQVTFAAPGSWYIMVYSRSAPAPSQFTLLARTNAVFLNSVSPTQYATNQTVALTIGGSGFLPGTHVALVPAVGPDLPATLVQINSFSQLTATFDLTGVGTGTYDIRVTLPGVGGASDLLPGAFTVLPAGQAHLETHLILPGVLGRHATATFYVEYANTGTVAMPAPILILQNTNGLRPLLTLDHSLLTQGLWTSSQPEGYSHSIQIYASGATAGVLQPGERIRVPVYYAGLQQPWDFNNDNVQHYEIRIHQAGNTDPIDWAGMKDALRPSWIPADAWNGVYANLIAQVGSTWGDYVRMLNANAVYLGQLGLQVTDVNELFSFAMQQALGLSPVAVIASANDASVPTPGLALGFPRSFGNSITERYQMGPFGRGWTAPWQISLEVQTDGKVIIHESANSMRVFQPDSRSVGRYFSQAGDTGVLRKVTGGAFELTETNGQVMRFRADQTLEYLQDINSNRITADFTDGRLTKLTHSSGASIDIAYDDGLIASITSHASPADVTGRTTTYTYDHINRLLLSATGPGGTTTYTYETGASAAKKFALLSVTDASNVGQLFQYDSFGRLSASFLTGNAQRVNYAYHLGACTATDAAGISSTTFFDHRGLVVRTEDGLGDYLRYEYNGERQLIRVTDSLGHTVSYTRCDCGRPKTITDELGNTSVFTLGGPNNDPTALTDAKGNITRFGYDAHGNLTTTTYADGSIERAVLDALGNASQLINRRGQAINMTRNDAGQVTREDFPDGTFNTYTYDLRGRLETATDSHGVTTFSYDNADRLSRVDYPQNRWIQYTYDAAGRRTFMEDNSGFKIRYQYDTAGRLIELDDARGPVESIINIYHYNSAGRLESELKGNGTYTLYTFDGAGRVATIFNYAPDDTINSKFIYAYDPLGRRISMETSDGLWTYTYDLTGQLTRAVFASTNPQIQSQDLNYTYDALGNRVRTVLNGNTTDYASNNLNQYTSVGGVPFNYDLDGNLTNDGTRQYTYDARNRLIQVTMGADTWQYEYDAFGNRIASIVNGVRTEFLIDALGDPNRLGDYDVGGNRSASYVFGLGLELRVQNGDKSYFDFDALGSTSGLTDSHGAFLNRYVLAPFGEQLFSSGPGANPFRFVGQFGIMDEGNGLAFMRARFEVLDLGRFAQKDPLSILGGFNVYTYAHNNPISRTDPSGLLDWGGNWTICKDEYGNEYIERGVCSALGPIIPGMRDCLRGERAKSGHDTGGFWQNRWDEWVRHIECSPCLFSGFGVKTGFGDTKCKPPPPPKDPDPPSDQGDDGDSGTVGSQDPNDLLGPAGFGTQHFIGLGVTLPYRIDFENASTATAPAQRVYIINQLSSDLDWNTFEFTDLGFGDTNLVAPDNSQHFETSVFMTFNSTVFNVDVVADMDSATGLVTITIQSVDPDTQLPPPVDVGFLPPEDGTGRGQGHVSYLILPKLSLTTGTEIRNIAQIQFDSNATIATNQKDPHDPSQGTDPEKEALVTIDAEAPTSSVNALAVVTHATTFPVTWHGDDASGSGVSFFDVFVSDNSGPFHLFMTHTSDPGGPFTGVSGHTYRFYSVATDHVGLRQPTPLNAQTHTTIITDLLLADDFSQDDGALIDPNWQSDFGGHSVHDGKVEGGFNNNLMTTTAGITGVDVVVQADVTLPTVGDSQLGLVARYTGPGDENMYWGMLFRVNGTTFAWILRQSGGSWNVLDFERVSGDPSAGTLRFELVGSSLKLFLDGKLVASNVDADPLMAAGAVGVRATRNTTFDNFSAKAVLNDAFTQPDGSPLNPSTWVHPFGNSTVTGNVLNSGRGLNLETLEGVSQLDVSVEADVTLATAIDSQVGLVARYSGPVDTNMYWGMLFRIDGVTYAWILRQSNGNWDVLDFQLASGNPLGGKMRFDAIGDNLTLSLDGNIIASSVDANPLLTSGSVGIRATGGTQLDNFREIPQG